MRRPPPSAGACQRADRRGRQAPPIGGDGSPGRTATSAATTISGSIRAKRYTMIDGQLRTSLSSIRPTAASPELPEPGKQPATRQAPGRPPTPARTDPGWGGASRRYRKPPARRTVPGRVQFDIGSADSSDLLLQQPPPDRADPGLRRDPHRDGARRPRHPVGGTHPPPTIKKWLGDSIGHWDGDTLVVETTNFNDNTRFMGSTANLKITERFTRLDDGRCAINSPPRIRRRGRSPGPSIHVASPRTTSSTSTRATKATTRWATFCAGLA